MHIARLAALGLAALALATPGRGAEAAILACGATALARVQHATACIYDTAFTNDSEAVVNRSGSTAAGYFGFKDWDQLARRQDSDHKGRSGEFDVTGFTLGANATVMLVFKSGSSNNSPSLIAYLVPITEGDWRTPFTRDPFPNHPRNGRDVSHVTYYARFEAPTTQTSLPPAPSGVPVPEPATLALFGLGLAGLTALRRARRPA